MKKRQGIWMLAMLALALVSAARAQESAQSSTSAPDNSSDKAQDTQQQIPPPMPPSGQDTTLPSIAENPPISGLDQPTLEPHSAPLSYIQPGATVSESADSNVGNIVGGGGAVQSISRGLGSVQLQRLWSHFDLAAQYIGGVAYYNETGLGWKALQQLDLQQKINWKRGEFSIRDSFSYLPEGNFGAAYGSIGSQGIESLGTTAFGIFAGGANLGTLGLVPRITNVAIADVSESLTPKSTVTAAGGYAVTHFYGTEVNPIPGEPPLALLNNSEVSAQGGYDRILSPRTQVAVLYGYQGFDFSSFGEAFHSDIVLGMYGHRITGRMDFLIAAGPQITDINLGGVSDRKLGGAGRMRLRYQFTRTSVDLSYERFETGGSGFFAGAETDYAVLSANHSLTRVWNVFTDLGYSRNSRIGPLATAGISANQFSYGFVGVGVHRAFGHDFHGFASYQFNRLAFDDSYCAGLPECSRIGNRSVGTIGLDWTPRPIRLD
jgi:hypothetical protein